MRLDKRVDEGLVTCEKDYVWGGTAKEDQAWIHNILREILGVRLIVYMKT